MEKNQQITDDDAYTVFEGSAIEASFPATEDGWKTALAYRDDALEKLANVGERFRLVGPLPAEKHWLLYDRICDDACTFATEQEAFDHIASLPTVQRRPPTTQRRP
jgi:hypothetical protein